MEQVLDNSEVVEFECGDEDLNDFIINDAGNYHRNLLSESYLLKEGEHLIAYVTILNDSLDIDSFEDRTAFNRFRRKHFVKVLTSLKRFSGCRFVTVDAYDDAIPFYAKNGFVVISSSKSNSETTLMYYDLMAVKP